MAKSKQQHFVPKNEAQLKIFRAMANQKPCETAYQQMRDATDGRVRSARAADLHALMRDHTNPQMELPL